MNIYFVTFRSVTLAQRGEVALKKKGIACTLQRTPKWMEEQGCGYCLRMRLNNTDEVMQIFRTNRVEYRRIYLQKIDGTVEALR